MDKVKCKDCRGTGKMKGAGYMDIDCEHCDGMGKVYQQKDDIEELALRQSDNFKNAASDLGDEKAKEIYEEEFKKELVKLKKGRK